jgi:hypothetical protein
MASSHCHVCGVTQSSRAHDERCATFLCHRLHLLTMTHVRRHNLALILSPTELMKQRSFSFLAHLHRPAPASLRRVITEPRRSTMRQLPLSCVPAPPWMVPSLSGPRRAMGQGMTLSTARLFPARIDASILLHWLALATVRTGHSSLEHRSCTAHLFDHSNATDDLTSDLLTAISQPPDNGIMDSHFGEHPSYPNLPSQVTHPPLCRSQPPTMASHRWLIGWGRPPPPRGAMPPPLFWLLGH